MPTVIVATALDDPSHRIALHEAQARWVRAAQDVLEEVAGEWARVIDERELAEHIQQRSGVRTKNRRGAWLPKVLGLLIMYAHSREKPQLVSLVVDTAGGVSEAYSGVLMLNNMQHADDHQREAHALAQRMLCYRAGGADVPEGATAADLVSRPGGATAAARRSGRPGREQAAAAPQRKSARPEPIEPPMQVCTTCWLQKPPGVPCPNCD